jgi:YVTN family beta-propeller protein
MRRDPFASTRTTNAEAGPTRAAQSATAAPITPARPAALRLAACAALAATLAACAAASGPGGGASSTAAAGAGGAVVATIPLDTFGTGVAVTPDGSRVYVTGSTQIFAIDAATDQVIARITPGDSPYGIAISRDGTRGYAVDLMQRQLWILDLASNRIAETVGLGAPRTPVLRPGVALSPDGSRAWVTISQPGGPDSLRIVDTASARVAQTHGFDFHPGPVAVSPDGGRVYVAGCHGFCSDGTLHALEVATLRALGEVETASVPGGLAVAPDGSRAWVTNGTAASVTVVDLASLTAVATVSVPAGALGVATSPDGSRVYVSSFDAGKLSVLDARTNAVLATSAIGESPRAIAVSPDGRRAYVTSSKPRVYVVDTTRLLTP